MTCSIKDDTTDSKFDPVKKFRKDELQQGFVFNLWWTIFSGIFILTLGTRFYKISENNWACWDEVHFGKHAAFYINRTFFFDVHPPLGKMMIGAMGYMSGYDGYYNFSDVGIEFGEQEDKVMGMRLGCTLIGTLIIPVGFLTIWILTCSLSAATLAAMMLVCDGGFAVINRYILLDPLLMLFMSASVLSNVKFRSLTREQEFTGAWWLYLCLTGTMLACTISVKFVGLFVISFIGLNTVYDLWSILGDTSNTWTQCIQHFLSRAVCLIVLPMTLYMLFFAIHFTVLSQTGGGDTHYGARFQTTLQGNYFREVEIHRFVEYGSNVTVKASSNFPCAYLHSHDTLYPEGLSNGAAPQQMVSNYLHRDDNNVFTLVRAEGGDTGLDSGDNIVRHGDLVLVKHLSTGRHLHSHNVPALVARHHYQVTGYGEEGVGDDNDVWRVEIIGGKAGDKVETALSHVRFRHRFLNCLLACTSEPFPSWGFGQSEVACSPWQRQTKEKRGYRKSTWLFEENNVTSSADETENPKIKLNSIAMGFLEKFIESHRVMFWINARLADEDHNSFDYTKQIPIRWPTNLVSQIFSAKEPRVYLLGNPRIWILNLAILLIFPLILLLRLVRTRQPVDMFEQTDQMESSHLQAATMMFTLWAIHYLPFFLMQRTLYIHHYYPALYFSSLLSGVFIDWTMKCLIRSIPEQVSPMLQFSFNVCFLSMLVYSYVEFSPLVYGMTGDQAKHSNSSYHHLYWVDWWWDF